MEDRRAGETVSVEEHERLRRDFAALQEQFEAADEVLSAMGRSAGDPDAVLTTIVESARRLCRSQAAHLYLLEDGVYRLIKSTGLSEESIRFIAEHPMPLDRDTLIGRVGLDRTDPADPRRAGRPGLRRHDLQRVAGFRTTMGAPMLLDDEVVGALVRLAQRGQPVRRAGDGDRHGVRRVRPRWRSTASSWCSSWRRAAPSSRRRSSELEALREVGEAVSSSLDVDHVLSTIAMHAVELSGTDGGSIMEYAERDRCFMVRSVYRTDPGVVERLRVDPHRPRRDAGRPGGAGAPPDRGAATSSAVDLDPHLQILHDAGWRSLVAVPMLREDQIVGSLVVRRKRTGDFTEETLDLLETFASQSALALLNARLFRELEEQSVELEVASRHKSEFLASMSHELRTPLNAVLGFSEVLLERMFGEINERQEEYLRDIHGSGQHLLELLNEILDLSKVEAGRMELEYAVVRPARAARAAPRPCSASGPPSTASSSASRSATTSASVYADELRLKQVVLNLLTNAVKFTGDGGSVVVRAVA